MSKKYIYLVALFLVLASIACNTPNFSDSPDIVRRTFTYTVGNTTVTKSPFMSVIEAPFGTTTISVSISTSFVQFGHTVYSGTKYVIVESEAKISPAPELVDTDELKDLLLNLVTDEIERRSPFHRRKYSPRM